jgi:hypothetical protein
MLKRDQDKVRYVVGVNFVMPPVIPMLDGD